ncbi:hypothetical protein [Methylobacterium pseudosasicola]|uniref:Uncharacterized protein n=1 Tax=Methylobacterium pseudosasicola TaxID=582667 RepID=A0A1I4PYZ2_9HYPH|nr:hypothetical protein [Methylobacterium pseudosasicola]SFM33041.1 hypothetical protein SAMN05192568_102745 [Methylobacterium pseudosasicola]
MTTRILLGAALGLTLSTAALAQSYTAPAGIPATTAPGGLEGRAALPNLMNDRGRTVGLGQSYETTDDLVTGALRRPHRNYTGGVR